MNLEVKMRAVRKGMPGTEESCSVAVNGDEVVPMLGGENFEVASPSQLRPSCDVALEDEPQLRRK